MSVPALKGVNPPRLCVLTKRSDFVGYGFNLQAEKGKPGQFIGNVDSDSPADRCGVKRYDRVIEVNGVNVCNEGHKQVVSRIKENPDEVALLVLDPESERKYLENGIVVKSDMDIVERHGAIRTSTVAVLNGGDQQAEYEVTPQAENEEPNEDAPAAVIAVEEAGELHEGVASEEAEISSEQPESEEAAIEDGMESMTVTVIATSPEEADEDSRETTQEKGLDGEASTPGSVTYEVTPDTPERLEEPQLAEETVSSVNDNEVNEREASPPPSEIAAPETPPASHSVPPTAPVNGSAQHDNQKDSIFRMSAAEARAAQSRSRRRAIKETNQTFKEKFLVFENL